MPIRMVLLLAILHCVWIDVSTGLSAQFDLRSAVDQDAEGLFLRAIIKHDVDYIEKTLAGEHGFSTDFLSNALVAAAYYQNVEIEKLLIKAGANVNYKNDDLSTPLGHAAIGHLESVELLLDNGADPNLVYNHDNRTAIHTALTSGHITRHIPIINLLIKHGANVNAESHSWLTFPIHAATYYDSPPTIEILIKAGANLNAVQHDYGSNSKVDGKTALEMAAEHAHVEIVDLLLKSGADPHVSDETLNRIKNLADKNKNEFGYKQFEPVLELLKAN